MTDSVTLKLSKPVRNATAQDVSELTFRPLTAGDIRKCGYPRIMTGPAEYKFDTEVLAKMIGATANLPMSHVDTMAPGDFDEACAVMMGFFMGSSPETSST